MPTFLLPPLKEFCAWASVIPASRIESGRVLLGPHRPGLVEDVLGLDDLDGLAARVLHRADLLDCRPPGAARTPENVIGVLVALLRGQRRWT